MVSIGYQLKDSYESTNYFKTKGTKRASTLSTNNLSHSEWNRTSVTFITNIPPPPLPPPPTAPLFFIRSAQTAAKEKHRQETTENGIKAPPKESQNPNQISLRRKHKTSKPPPSPPISPPIFFANSRFLGAH